MPQVLTMLVQTQCLVMKVLYEFAIPYEFSVYDDSKYQSVCDSLGCLVCPVNVVCCGCWLTL